MKVNEFSDDKLQACVFMGSTCETIDILGGTIQQLPIDKGFLSSSTILVTRDFGKFLICSNDDETKKVKRLLIALERTILQLNGMPRSTNVCYCCIWPNPVYITHRVTNVAALFLCWK